MKKILCILLLSFLMLCGCSNKETLEIGHSYTVSLEENYIINLEYVSTNADHFEFVVSKDSNVNYFILENEDSSVQEWCDLAFLESKYIDYVIVNDQERIDYTVFAGGVAYGVRSVFVIKSFENSVNLKFYLKKEKKNTDYKLQLGTIDAKSYYVNKYGSIEKLEANYIITAINFTFE